MSRSVAQKMGIREGARAFIVSAPETALRAIDLPAVTVRDALDGTFDYIHLFTVTQTDMDTWFPNLRAHLKASGMLWVSWPKARKLGTDLSLPKVIKIGYRHGLVESTCLRIDDDWAGLKFTHAKKGKVYNNRYGTLPARR